MSENKKRLYFGFVISVPRRQFVSFFCYFLFFKASSVRAIQHRRKLSSVSAGTSWHSSAVCLGQGYHIILEDGMHMCGRAPFAFNEQNIAAIRKIMAAGPLPQLPGFEAAAPPPAHGDCAAAGRAARRAAVLVPLCNRDGVASMLFTVRSSKVSTHKGQVSFPGGHIEAGEDSVEAALRETREEIGDSLGSVEVLGLGQTLTAVTGTPVTPVLAFVQEDIGPVLPNLVLSPDEVESVFTLSVDELLDPSFRVMDDLGLRGRLPAFTAGPSRVWGLTAVIAEGVLQRAVIPLLKDLSLMVDDTIGDESSKGPGSSSL